MGFAANMLGRKFIGIDEAKEFLYLGIQIKYELDNVEIDKDLIEGMTFTIFMSE